MKPKELYERILNLGAKIGGDLTTEKRTMADAFIEGKADRFIDKYSKIKMKNERDFADEWCNIYTDIYELGFVKGYLVGQLFDFNDPKILKNIKVIKKELIKEGLFDFVPKEKKAA